MQTTTTTTTSRTPLILLLLALVPLAALMAWVFEHYNSSPFYPGYHFPRNASLAVWPDTGTIWKLADTRAMCLDLTNGRLSSVQAGGDFLSLRDSHGIGYELGPDDEQGFAILAREGLAESTKVICRFPSYARFHVVHADRYLLEHQFDQVIALDVQAVTSGEGSKMILATPGHNPAIDQLCVVSGQSVFLVPCSNTVPLSVRACTIESGQMKELASWPVGGTQALVVISGNRILSLAPNGKSLEVRSFDDLTTPQQLVVDQVILQEWCMAHANLSTLTFADTNTAQFQTVRLSDFSRIAELDGLSTQWNRFRVDPQSTDALTLFMRGTRNDLVIYDAVQGKVAAEFKLDEEVWYASPINDHQVAATSSRWGGTILVLDARSQQVAARYYPMFWPLVGAVCLSIATMVWCVLWLRNSARMRLPLAIDWTVLACVLVAPALYRIVSFDMWSTHTRYSVTIVQAGTVTALFAVSCYLFYGRARWPYRLIAWLAVTGGISLGLMQVHRIQFTVIEAFPGQAWTHFALVAGLSLMAAKLCGPLVKRAFASTEARAYRLEAYATSTATQTRRVQMIDWFALTTVLALLLVAVAASQEEFDFLKMSLGLTIAGPRGLLVAIGILSVQVVATQIVAACLFLTRATIVNRIGLALGVIACIVLVADPLMTLVATKSYLQLFQVALLARVIALCYLLTAAWAWRSTTPWTLVRFLHECNACNR